MYVGKGGKKTNDKERKRDDSTLINDGCGENKKGKSAFHIHFTF